jgi:hypothetical protein
MLAHTDEQTIGQVWMPPTLPVHTDEQTISSLRANFAWDKRFFIGLQRQQAPAMRLSAWQGTAPPHPAASDLRLAFERFDASARCSPPRAAFPSDLPAA